MDNLLEFALGGNPTNDDAAIYMPKSEVDGAVLNYIYTRQNPIDPALTYTVLDGTDLVIGGLVNTNVEVGVSAPVNGFETVTNQVSTTTGAKQFMQLKVQKD